MEHVRAVMHCIVTLLTFALSACLHVDLTGMCLSFRNMKVYTGQLWSSLICCWILQYQSCNILMTDVNTDHCFWLAGIYVCWQFKLLSKNCWFEGRHILVKNAAVKQRSSVTSWRYLTLARCLVLTLWLEKFGEFLWCCQQQYRHCWACGCRIGASSL